MKSTRLRILAISGVSPWIRYHGLSLRIRGLLPTLCEEADVHLVYLDDERADSAESFPSPGLAGQTRVTLPMSHEYVTKETLEPLVQCASGVSRDFKADITLCWLGSHYATVARSIPVPLVADVVDSATFEAWTVLRRRHSTFGRALRRLASEARAEWRAVRCAQAVVAAGAGDANTLSLLGARNAHTISNGVALPPTIHERGQNKVVTFVGNLDFYPNVDAVKWFVSDVWPAVRSAHSDAQFWIVGSNPLESVRSLEEIPGVSVYANVPSTAEYIQRGMVAVAPMRLGSGVKNKVLESWINGRPCVMTSKAVNGLKVPPEAHFLVCENASELASRITQLLASPLDVLAIGERLRAHASVNYSWDRAGRQMLAVIEDVFWSRNDHQ